MTIKAADITEEMKAEFVELLLDGKRSDEAARSLGTTSTQFNALINEGRYFYDEEFAALVKAAKEKGREAFQEDLLDAAVKTAKAGNSTIMTLLLKTYHPDFEWSRHANFRVSGTVDHVHQLAERYTREQLEQMKEARVMELEQEQKVKLLPPPAA